MKKIYLWQRWIGGIAALFFLLIALFGLLLNHSDELKLANKKIYAALLLYYYGIEPIKFDKVFLIPAGYISQVHEAIFIDEYTLPSLKGELIAAHQRKNLIYIAVHDQIALFDQQFNLIEIQPLPQPARKMAVDAQGLIFDSGWRIDFDLIAWQRHNIASADWIKEVVVPNHLKPKSSPLSRQRFLLDLHSGRLFGNYGVYLVDVLNIALLWLAGSGLLLKWRRWRKKS